MNSFLDKIFKLPPIEKRKPVGSILQTLMAGKFSSEHDDTYIFYKCFRTSFILSLLFAALNVISLMFNIDFNFIIFSIDIPQSGFNKEFPVYYSYYMSGILLVLVLPFYYIMFRRNVKWEDFVPFWWNPEALSGDNERDEMKNLKTIGLCLLIMLFGGWGFSGYAGSYRQESSIGFFILSLLMTPYTLAAANQLLLICLLTSHHLEKLTKNY